MYSDRQDTGEKGAKVYGFVEISTGEEREAVTTKGQHVRKAWEGDAVYAVLDRMDPRGNSPT